LRGDAEAWLTGCRQRFGIVRPGCARPLLTHTYRVPPDFDESRHHQLELWENLLKYFGLAAPPNRAPFNDRIARPSSPPPPIGLIAGSENMPAKRWPAGHWRALIESLPDDRFVLFGTHNDAAITDAIADGFGRRVGNLAGKTDLLAFADQLRRCRLLVTNDTGGMHLANALGVPVIALFGPTNPLRTAPVFDSPLRLLQPPGCPPTGGGSLENISPATVSLEIRTWGSHVPQPV
ncbi:MAG: glycosyltransferase family 9 protein, partial [Opitutaceae bacterium]